MTDQIELVRAWLSASTRIVALTGAGISTESGVPDFRGPQGLWTTNPKAEKLSNIHYYMSPGGPQARVAAAAFTSGVARGTESGHLALAELERTGRLHALITQNIDGLHQKAGTRRRKSSRYTVPCTSAYA